MSDGAASRSSVPRPLASRPRLKLELLWGIGSYCFFFDYFDPFFELALRAFKASRKLEAMVRFAEPVFTTSAAGAAISEAPGG